MKKKPETAEQRKLREASELVKAAKEAERKAWHDRWKAKQADPVCRAKEAQRDANREERSRKIAIGKENNALALIAEMSGKHNLSTLYETAVHEACHAVMQELVANGVREVTITPGVHKSLADNGITDDGKYAGCSVSAGLTLGVTKNQSYVWQIVTSVAPQIGMPKAFPEYAELLEDGDEDDDYYYDCTQYTDRQDFLEAKEDYEAQFGGDENIIEMVLKASKLPPKESWKLRNEAELIVHKSFADPKVWAALLEVADALMTDKTLSGNDVRLIVRKHTQPHLAVQFDAGAQLSFHYRKNRYQGWRDYAPFVLGIGVTTGTSGYYDGYQLSQPKYVQEVIKSNVLPAPFPVPPVKVKLSNGNEVTLPGAVQLSFTFPPHAATALVAPAKKTCRKTQAVAA